MVETKILPQAPVLVGERVLDDRATRFGKQIVERDFRMPNGEVLPILCVINRGMDPVIVFALTEHETVFLVHQFRFGINGWILELPGGGPKPGQTCEETARTELLEEVGVEAGTIQVIGELMAFNPMLENIRFNAVLATGCRVVRAPTHDRTEIMTGMEVSVVKFRQMLKNGEMTDAKTVATGYLALDCLGQLE